MTDDEWQAHLTREVAKKIGAWLEGKGDKALQRPICSLTMADLEAMAINAISCWIVLQSERLKRDGWPRQHPIRRILLG